MSGAYLINISYIWLISFSGLYGLGITFCPSKRVFCQLKMYRSHLNLCILFFFKFCCKCWKLKTKGFNKRYKTRFTCTKIIPNLSPSPRNNMLLNIIKVSIYKFEKAFIIVLFKNVNCIIFGEGRIMFRTWIAKSRTLTWLETYWSWLKTWS